MIPISQFITPTAPVAKTDYSSLGDLGDFLNKRNQFNATLDENKRQADQSADIARQKNADTTRYYDMQADTHRMEAEDRGAARREHNQQLAEKRVAQLRDALRKARSPAEKHAILEQIAMETGGTIEEAPNEAVQAATAVAETQKGGAPKLGGGSAAQFAAFMEKPDTAEGSPVDLGQEAPGRGAPFGPPGLFASPPGTKPAEPPAAAAPPGAAPPVNVPGLNMGAFSSRPPSQPQAPTGSGRFILKDKEGRVQQIWDEGAESERNRQVVRQALAPYINDPANKEMAAAAERAATSGADVAVGHPDGIKAGIEYAKSQFQKEMGGFKKEARPSKVGTGGGGVPTKLALKLNAEALTTYNTVLDNVAQQQDVKAANTRRAFATQALDHLNAASQQNSGMQELGALKDYMLVESGKTVTDKEMDQFLGSAGAWEKMKFKLAQYTSEGRMPSEFKRQLRGLLDSVRGSTKGVLGRAAQTAREQIGRLPMGLSPEDQADLADTAAASFDDDYRPLRKQQKSGGGGAPAPSAAAPTPAPAPASRGRSRAEEWLNSQGPPK